MAMNFCFYPIQVQPDVLWDRIQQRLKEEPFRVKFREDQRTWMDETVLFYESKLALWTHVLDNSGTDPALTALRILTWLKDVPVSPLLRRPRYLTLPGAATSSEPRDDGPSPVSLHQAL